MLSCSLSASSLGHWLLSQDVRDLSSASQMAWFSSTASLTLLLKDAPVFSLLILCPACVINALHWLHLCHMIAGISQPCGVFALLEEMNCNSDVSCGERHTERKVYANFQKTWLTAKPHQSRFLNWHSLFLGASKANIFTKLTLSNNKQNLSWGNCYFCILFGVFHKGWLI